MPWTDFLKSKAPSLAADGRLRWFGKLPTYADYYVSAANAEWAVEFNDWVLNGFARYASSGKAVGQRLPRLAPTLGILRLPKSGMTAIALFEDYGGDMHGRPFPIVFYVAIPSESWGGPLPGTFCCVGRLFDEFVALDRELTAFVNTPARFEAVFGDRQLDLSPLRAPAESDDWKSALTPCTVADWHDAAGDGAQRAGWAAWAGAVRRTGEAVSQHSRDRAFEPTFLFPLAKGLPVDNQVAAWLGWLGLRMDLRARFLSLMLPLDTMQRSGRLVVVARPPVADDFMLMTPRAESLPYVESLVRAGDHPGSGPASDNTPEEAVGETGWLEFLSRR